MKIKLGKLLLSVLIAASLNVLYADGFAIDSNKFKTSPFDDGFLTVYGASGLEDGRPKSSRLLTLATPFWSRCCTRWDMPTTLIISDSFGYLR